MVQLLIFTNTLFVTGIEDNLLRMQSYSLKLMKATDIEMHRDELFSLYVVKY
jgi:hypothetical protein